MTKIKVDIESDETIIAAKILLKHANGTTEIEDIDTDTEESSKKKSKIIESGIDDAFRETY